MNSAATLGSLVVGTLVSEDLTSILAGGLVHDGHATMTAAIAACTAGIYLGDLLLYGLGALCARRVRSWPSVRRWISGDRLAQWQGHSRRQLPALICSSRLVPGSRLPLYLAAGAVGGSFRLFAGWTLLAVSVWTPLVVYASARSAARMEAVLDHGWAGLLAAGLLLLTVRSLLQWIAGRRVRQRLTAAISRIWRWEFWPMPIFYAPVALWVGWLMLRYRGAGVVSAANPGIPDGGIVGESKHAILERLPAAWTIPAVRLDEEAAGPRLQRLREAMTSRQWAFPLVIKPDVGQRGAGVRLVRTLAEARHALEEEPRALVVQPYHPGPFEAGVFYYRMPDWPRGRILSITDKHFPVVTGDGESTLEALIWAHPRFRMQAATLLSRHAATRDRVLGAGERLPLTIAGNHCQGTLFRDGRHLLTPALEQRIDEIARAYPGFYIGRFDIRYSAVERFMAGEDLAIVELNGATAESTNIYDPDGSLWQAYRQLARQWSLVFAIGAANRRRGAVESSPARLWSLAVAHLFPAPRRTLGPEVPGRP